MTDVAPDPQRGRGWVHRLLLGRPDGPRRRQPFEPALSAEGSQAAKHRWALVPCALAAGNRSSCSAMC